jgi:hypothetical protein
MRRRFDAPREKTPEPFGKISVARRLHGRDFIRAGTNLERTCGMPVALS